jgi:hypothetical protein
MGLQLSSTAHSSHNDCLFGRKEHSTQSSAGKEQRPALKKHTTAEISPPHKRRLLDKKADKVVSLYHRKLLIPSRCLTPPGGLQCHVAHVSNTPICLRERREQFPPLPVYMHHIHVFAVTQSRLDLIDQLFFPIVCFLQSISVSMEQFVCDVREATAFRQSLPDAPEYEEAHTWANFVGGSLNTNSR